ncbi:MAG: 2-oxoglutarate dehydrogenase E1 component, partial [Nitrosospira sp.]
MMKQLFEDSLLFGTNASFIEGLYEKYLHNPESIPREWHEYFDKLRQGEGTTGPAGQASQNVPYSSEIESLSRPAATSWRFGGLSPDQELVQDLVWRKQHRASSRSRSGVLA